MPAPPSAPDAEAVEILELVDFLAQTPPFDALDRSALLPLARSLEISYAPSDTTLLAIDDTTELLTLIRTGAVELYDDDGGFVTRLGERDFFGYPSLLTDHPAQRTVRTIEDTLLYQIPKSTFDDLRSDYPAVDRFFARAHTERIRDALQEKRKGMPLLRPVRTLLERDPITIPPGVSIQQAALRMRDNRVSALLVVDDTTLVGILTDRDLRTRVVATGRSVDMPVSEVMTPDPATISAEAPAFEALLTMSRHNVHHLPVVEPESGSDSSLVGVVTTTDLMRAQADHPVYLIGDIWKQTTVDGLARVSRRLPQLVVQLADSHARAADTSRVVTSISDALTQRLLELAQETLGPPPVPFAWMALGSQARREQTAHSDQDHALLLADSVDADARDGYFQDLATIVSDGLNACGFVYCPGEVMATTDQWRQPLQTWKHHFQRWIEEPQPKSLMHASIFFDLRCVAGSTDLVRELRQFVLERTTRNSIFLACLTVNALNFTPPLGFFRQFVLEEHGGQEDTLDLKHNGLVPIVDIARINALARGIDAVNTLERLAQLAGGTGMATSDAADLRDAYDFIAGIRLQHQARQIRQGEEPDNYISPSALSDFDRRHLKDAFKVVRRMQSALEQRYQTGLISR